MLHVADKLDSNNINVELMKFGTCSSLPTLCLELLSHVYQTFIGCYTYDLESLAHCAIPTNLCIQRYILFWEVGFQHCFSNESQE